jgi:hypothetical protein
VSVKVADNLLSDKDLSAVGIPPTFLEMAEKEPARIGLHVSLIPRAREVIDNIRAETGVTQTEAMARILEHFAALPAPLRAAILNRDASAREELIRATMMQVAGREALQRAVASADMDLASLAELMRAVAARFDAFTDAARKPPVKDRGTIRPSAAAEPAPRPRGR